MEDGVEDSARRYIGVAAAAARVGIKRRGSIVYPGSQSPARISGGLGVEVGLGTPRGLRVYSTRTSTIPLPELYEATELDIESPTTTKHITPSIRIIPQPNRVLMDLAGRDIPSSRRYNSSLSPEPFRSQDDLPLPPLPSASTTRSTPEELSNQEKDRQIYSAIMGRMLHIDSVNNREELASLVAHYRSSRTLGPLDTSSQPGDPTWNERLPLPVGFDDKTYNACLEALMALRQPGESIARILEAYNEMLERDIIPSVRTYQLVIRALCARESDVSLVLQRWEQEEKWAKWRAEGMGREYTPDVEQGNRDQLAEGYKAEGNLASALRLFSAAKLMKRHSKWYFQPFVYQTILKTIATQSRPDLGGLRQVFNHAINRLPRGSMGLYRYMFEALGKAGHAEEVLTVWKQYKAAEAEGKGKEVGDWVEDPAEADSDNSADTLELERLGVYQAAIRNLAKVGKMAEAEEILAEVEKREDTAERKSLANSYGALLVGIASRDVQAALARYTELLPKIKSTSLGRLPITEAIELVDYFTLAGEWRRSFEILDTLPKYRDVGIFRARQLYQAILIDAKKASTAEEAVEILSHIPSLVSENEFPISSFPIPDHLSILQQHNLWTHAEKIFQSWRHTTSNSNDWLPFLGPFFEAAASHMDIRGILRLFMATSNAGLNTHQVPHLVQLFADKYASDRATDPEAWKSMMEGMTIQDWERLIVIIRRLGGERFMTGENDIVLEQATRDILGRLANAKEGEEHDMDSLKADMGKILDKLEFRFGEKRTAEILGGMDIDGRYLGKDITEMSERSAGSPSSAVTRFSLPSPPSSATSITPPPASQHLVEPIFDHRDLSIKIDKHLGRDAKFTAKDAYDHIYDSITRHSSYPHPESIGRLLNTLGREGADEKVNNLYTLAQFVLQTRNTPHISNIPEEWRTVEDHMLIASCHLGHLERAGIHRQRIVDAGLAPSANAYATMIASAKDTTDDASVARALFDESQRMGVKPNLYLYNTIISKLSRARKAELALELFGHMKAAGVQPSSVTYGAVVVSFSPVISRSRLINRTLFVELEMLNLPKPSLRKCNLNQTLNLEFHPTSMSSLRIKLISSTMMQFFVSNGSREKVLHYYSLLRQAGVSPSAHTYKLLLDAFATLPPIDLTSMERVYSDLVADRSVQVQGTHLASLITAYGIYGDNLSKSMEIFESTTNRNLDAIVWEAILNVIAHRGTLGDLEGMRQKMESSKVRQTAYVYNVLITGYTRVGEIEAARGIFESMGDSVTGVAAPNNHPMLLTSSGYVKPQTITEEPTQLVYREPSTYEAMIRAEISVGEIERAREVLGRMEARGYPWAVYMKVKQIVDEASVSVDLAV